MKKKLLLFTFVIIFSFTSFGQDNPVENLTWEQSYQYPNNFFKLQWNEPLQPHGDLIGYNIYRNDELYRFQTETTLYNLYTDLYGFVSNCDSDFLIYNDPNQPNVHEFDIHVTAVYNPGETESTYLQTVHSYGAALNNTTFIKEKALLFPNPTKGIVNIGNTDLEKIIVYDISGKAITEFAPASQIDLSRLSKGLYIIKLFSERGVIVDKIVIE